MFRIYTTLLLICCFSKSYGQTERTKLNLSVRYLGADDITVQSRDGGKSFVNDYDAVVPGFDISVEFPARHSLWFSTGYRWKQKWITLPATNIGVSESSSDLHAVYAKLVWRKPLLQSYLANVFSFDLAGGLMINRTIPKDDYRTSSLDYGNYTGTVNWEKSPNYSAALDGMIHLNVRLYKRLYASAGYGFNYGLTKIKNGAYSFTGPGGVIESGTITSRGSYIYLLTGLKLQF